jgi:hypothetical protein
MIVRKEADGTTVLIAQTDHSRLVGQLAAHWGNADFATPRPYESVARAAAFHDFGWLRYETAPYFDPETGGTPTFFRVPGGEQRLDDYRWCNDTLLADDPYAGLLVSMHRTGLWRGRYGALNHPPHAIPPSLPAAIEEFIDRSETRQALECSMTGATEVWTNYQLLQVWDQLGLYFTCQDPYTHYIEPVPTEYGDKNFVGLRMNVTPVSASQVAFAPYPFDVRPLRIQFTQRHLPAQRFVDEAAFRCAYFQARLELVEYELV